MKKHKLPNRILSGVMSAVITITTVFVPAATAIAADYYIRFLDTATGKPSDVAYIVEGTSLNIEASLPDKYTISETKPFAVRKSGDVTGADASGNFTIKRNTSKSYTVTANAGAASGSVQEYTLDAIYSSIISAGTGSGSYDDNTDPDNPISNRYILEVVASPEVAITEDSSIQFSAISNETPEGAVSFSPVKTANGSFSIYKNCELKASAIKTKGGQRYFTIDVIPPSGTPNPTPLKATVYIEGSASILNGTDFSIDFRRQTINSLLATVITVPRALEDTALSVENNPTFPGATEIGVPYVKLSEGDTLESIRTSFEVLSKVHRYNIDINLEWSWLAENNAYNNYVSVDSGALGKTTFNIKQRPVEDMKGHLIIKAKYSGAESVEHKIPVTIYGTGSAVGYEPVTQTTGVPGNPPTDKIDNITKLPAIMDVYDGRADFAEYSTAPNGPYKFTASLNFGSGRGVAQYAIIKNNSQGGEFEIFIDNAVVKYTLGEKIENIGNSKSIELVATKSGQCNLVVEYYNNLGELMSRNTINQQIKINDSSPNKDGRLKDLELHLSGATNADDKQLGLVYKNGIMDYSFNPDTNEYRISVPHKAEKIALLPKLPADTDAKKLIEYTYDSTTATVNAGSKTANIALDALVPKKVQVTVKAQNGDKNTYTLTFVRDEQSKESRLKELEAIRADGVAGNLITGFSPDKLVYDISVPFKVNEIQLKANAFSPWAQAIDYLPAPKAIRFLWWEWPTNKFDLSADYDEDTGEITNNVTTITVTVTAEDGLSKTTYTLNFTRMPPSSDNTLAALAVTDKLGNQIAFVNNQKFDPAVRDYYVEIPYTTQEVNITAKHNQDDALNMTLTEPDIYGADKRKVSLRAGAETIFRNVDTNQVLAAPEEAKNAFSYTVEVEAENKWLTLPPYTIHFTRAPASDDNLLSSIKVFDEKNNEIKFSENMVFNPDLREYYISIPYSANTINIEATNRHGKAQKMLLTEDAKYGGNTTTVALKPDELKATRFSSLNVKQNMTAPDANLNAFDYKLEVIAENSALTAPPYIIHVVRSAPNADTRLKNLTITDQNNVAVDTFAFNQEQLEYTIPVPYETTHALIKPEALSPAAQVTVDRTVITASRPSLTVELTAGKERVVTVSVTSESAETRIYTLKFTRAMPSTEARLSDLKVDALTLSPKFYPATTAYEITIPEGTKGYSVTPTAFDQFATITVNDKLVKSGEKSQTFKTIDPISTATVKVTAQDGKTQLIYTITVRDDNLIEKSNNADLAAVSISGASLTPRFKANMFAYDVAISPSTDYVDIKPRPADANATVTVLEGTKELQLRDGAYSTGIREDETEIKIKVVSQDKKNTQEYDFVIYKSDEDKQGIYKPITADMVDWTKNPIYVDISKYPVVSAEVFNKLKTEFPDTTMILTGNDYSLSIKGSDITTLVPNTDLYDFSLSFKGPNYDAIMGLIKALDSRNAAIAPVIIHFNHHGSLPGPMNLTVSLGGFYKNIRMYWNYFNPERNRIDYYGYVKTNAQGTFAVPITHMSDYIISPSFIYGSENKVGTVGGGGENIGGAINGKPNPSTGGYDN